MANRKLSKNAQPLDEVVAQTFNLCNAVGRDIEEWRKAAKEYGMTTDTALIRRFAAMMQLKDVRGYDGSRVQVQLGPMVRGARLARVIPGKLVHERVGTSQYSGKKLVRAYPVSVTLYDASGNVSVRAGYTNDTRLSAENIIGPDHADLAVTMLNRLGTPEFKALLDERVTHTDAERERKTREVLDNPLDRMPDAYRQMIKDHGINVDLLRHANLLSIGEHLIQEHWSAVLFALDVGKNRNLVNWFNEQADKGKLPEDVRQDWAYIKQFPYRENISEKLKNVGSYQLQWKSEGRKAVAGNLAEELRWLASSRKSEAKYARELYNDLYGKHADLKTAHEPAIFYAGSQPPHAETIDKLLGEPFWTVADREGVLRKFPMTEFRQSWTREIIKEYFGSVREFSAAIQQLDAAVKAKKVPVEHLPFVQHVLKRMKIGELDGVPKAENYLRRTRIDKAETEADKLKVMYGKYAKQ
jgi:hypothetical protein